VLEVEDPGAGRGARPDDGLEHSGGEDETHALPHPAAGPHQRLPGAAGVRPEQHHFHPPAAGPAPAQAGRQDPGIIEHEDVRGVQQRRQIAEDAVGEAA
jgi:hypothetical protein